MAKNRQIFAILKATLFALVLSFSSLNAFSGGGTEGSATVGYQCKMQIVNPGCTGDICMNNYKNIGYLQQENQWCYANNYYFTYDNDYINPYTSIKNGVSNSEYWLNSQTEFVPLNDFHGEFNVDINAEALWENNHSFLSAGTTQIENKNDMAEYYSLLDNIYNSNGDYDNTLVLPDLPYCDGYVFNGYDGGYDGAGLFTYCNEQTLTANYTSLDGTITIGSNIYDLEHLSNIAPLALNLEEDPDATYRFVCDSSSYALDYCNNQYVIDYLGNIHHSENEHGYAYISPLAVFMMVYVVPSSGSYFSADCSDQTLMECFGIGLDGNLPNGGNLYDYSRESVEEFMKRVFEYDGWGFGVDGNSPQFAPDSRQYQLMKLVNQYGIMRRNMVFESLGSGSGGSSGGTTPTPTTITLNWNENGGNAIANGSCTLNGNLTLPSAPTRSGYTFTGWKLADGTTKSAGETVSGGCTSTYTGVSSGISTSIQAQWEEQTCTSYEDSVLGSVAGSGCFAGKSAWNSGFSQVNSFFNDCANLIPADASTWMVMDLDHNVLYGETTCINTEKTTESGVDSTLVTERNLKTGNNCWCRVTKTKSGSTGAETALDSSWFYVDSSQISNYYDCKNDCARGCAEMFYHQTWRDGTNPAINESMNICPTPTVVNITINWDENGGNAIANGSCTLNGDLTLPSAPTRSGYIFNGWKLANNEVKVANTTITNGCTSTYTGVSSGTSTSITAQWKTETPIEFTLSTSETNKFQFKLSAAGTFYVDCGTGGTLSGTGVNGKIITRSDTNQATYTCSYSNSASHTIKFGGAATGYSADLVTDSFNQTATVPAIKFNIEGCAHASEINAGKIIGISGSLGHIFGTVENPDVGQSQPSFEGTFCDAINMLGTDIDDPNNPGMKYALPPTLFEGVHGAPIYKMFDNTFGNCYALSGSIPESLFSGISGAPAEAMFWDTFSKCSLTGKIPVGLFAGITGTPAKSMFGYTFSQTNVNGFTDGTNTTTYVPDTFLSGISTNTSVTNQTYNMFNYTRLTNCPAGMYNSTRSQFNDAAKPWCSLCPTVYQHSADNNTTGKTGCYAIVTFDANGGSEVPSQNVNYTANTISGYKITPPTSTKSGYTLEGWYQNSDLTDSAITSSTTFTSDKTLYAKWTPATITINWDENSGDAIADGSCIYGGNLTLPSAPTRSGYTFAGWKLADGTIKSFGAIVSGGCTETYIGGIISNVATGVQAQWTQPSCPINYHSDQSLTEIMGTSAAGVDYVVNGSDGQQIGSYSGLSSAVADIYGVQYAFAVYYGADKGYVRGRGVCSTQTGTSYTVINTSLPDNSGPNCYCQLYNYTSSGVTKNISSGSLLLSSYDDAGQCANNCSVNCAYGMRDAGQHALFLRTLLFDSVCSPDVYTITYNTNGGDAIEPYGYTYGLPAITLPTPTKTGYTFVGWYSDSELTDIVNSPYTPTQSLTLYAKWTLDSCGVGEYKNGNECSSCPEGFRDGTNADNIYMCYKSGTVNCSDYISVPNAVITTQNISAVCKTYYGTDVCQLDNLDACKIISFSCNTGYEEQDIPLSATDTNFSNVITKKINGNSCFNYLAVNEVDCDGDGFDKVAPGNWAATYNNGTLYGNSLCSATAGTLNVAGNPDTTTSGDNCWCRTERFNDESVMSSWISFDVASCESNCAQNCTLGFVVNQTFRESLFNNILTKECKPEVYTISFITNGGGTIEDIQYTYGSPAITLPTTTKENYTFDGWYSDSELTDIVNSPYTPTQSVTLYAKWEIDCPEFDNSNIGAYYAEPVVIHKALGGDYLEYDSIEDCVVPLLFGSNPSIVYKNDNVTQISGYNTNLDINKNDVGVYLFCGYNPTTTKYDRCYDLYAEYCKSGYYLTQSQLSEHNIPMSNESQSDAEVMRSVLATTPLNSFACVPAERGYYTATYDLIMAKDNPDSQELMMANNIGVIGNISRGMVANPSTMDTGTLSDVYKQCPDAYPDSEPASWQVAQCYATVTFMDGSTVLKTEQHDFDGTSDGVNVTTNAYHISNYQPNNAPAGYVFDGWYDNHEFDGEPITTTTDLTGNKTLYAKWTSNIIHCDAGYYLPANATQCSKCDYIDENKWCPGGDFEISSEPQGFQNCPEIQNYGGAAALQPSYGVLVGFIDYNNNNIKDTERDCGVLFGYSYDRDDVGSVIDSSLGGNLIRNNSYSLSYNTNSIYNRNIAWAASNCLYNPDTGLYDYCLPSDVWVGVVCKNGYYVPQNKIHTNFDGHSLENFFDEFDTSICVPAESGYYTNLYDLHKNDENNALANKVGVGTSPLSGAYKDIITDSTDEFTNLYKQCPDAYPDSEPASWQVAQCYATVTFMDGSTVLKTEQHDFDGTSDGVNVTTNAYHISNYQPNNAPAGYVFDGWYETSDFSGNKITTSTDLTGNKTLYAKWRVECPEVDNSSFGAMTTSLHNRYEDTLEECTVNFSYAFDNQGMSDTDHYYDKTNAINSSVYGMVLPCRYNANTNLYDLCTPATVYTFCKNGYYIGDPQYEISLYNKGNDAAYYIYPHRTPCVPAESGYYTNVYDLNKNNTSSSMLSQVGVGMASMFGSIDNMFIDALSETRYANQDLMYKKCPDAYPDSEPASWQVAQCYATVTFMDGSTVLKTEQHDFSGTSDGVNVTANAYHISDYQPNNAPAGYVFDGWYETSDFSGNKITTSTDLSGNKTLYAKWKLNLFNIKYYDGANELSDITPTTYTYSDDNQTITPIEPEKRGYTFNGWCLNSDNCDDSQKTLVIVGGTIGDINAYAQWTPNVYNINYYDWENELSGIYPDTYTYSASENQTITPNKPIKNGYEFVGWCVGANGCEETINTLDIPADTIGDIDLYAKWVMTISLHFDKNTQKDVIGMPNDIVCVYGQNCVSNQTPVLNNYEFNSWNLESDGSGDAITKEENGEYDFSNVFYFSGSENVTLYAQWTPVEYTITYDLDGGNATNPTSYNVETPIFTLNNPTKNGYEFIGWCETENCSTPELEYSFDTSIGGNKTLYAIFNPIRYTIIFGANGGYGYKEPVTCYYDSDCDISNGQIVRDGYVFTGWSRNTDTVQYPQTSNGISVFNLTNVPETMLFNAIWSANVLPLKYNHNDGTDIINDSCVYDTSFVPTVPTRPGYVFAGWDVSANTPVLNLLQ